MRDKINKFMQGRYGVDKFAQFTMGVALVCIVLAAFLGRTVIGGILDSLGLAAIVYTYFRMLSRNIPNRYAENQKYLSMTQNLRNRFRKRKRHDGAAQDTSYLYMPGLRTKNPNSPRKRKN